MSSLKDEANGKRSDSGSVSSGFNVEEDRNSKTVRRSKLRIDGIGEDYSA